MGRKPARAKSLDDLVLKVCHVQLSECKDVAEFRECIGLMVRNLDAVLAALAGYESSEPRIRRAVEDLKLVAVRVLRLCRAIPESFDPPERWREIAAQIAVNYEQFRVEAGHFYAAAIPAATFNILRSAL